MKLNSRFTILLSALLILAGNLLPATAASPDDYLGTATDQYTDNSNFTDPNFGDTAKKIIKSRWVDTQFVEGFDESLDLKLRRKKQSVDLGKNHRVTLKFQPRKLYKTKAKRAYVKIDIYEIDALGDRVFIGTKNLMIKKGAKNAYLKVDLNYFDFSSKILEFELHDTDGTLVNTYRTEIEAENLVAQTSSIHDLPPEDNRADCDSTVFGDCHMEYIFSRLKFETRRERTPAAGYNVNRDGTYTIFFPNAIRSQVKKGTKKRRKTKVNDDGSVQDIIGIGEEVLIGENGNGGVLEYLPETNSIGLEIFGTGSHQMVWDDSGFIGVGVSDPAAYLDIKGGDGEGPAIRIRSSVLSSTLLDGAIEYDGTNFYVTTGGQRQQLATTADIDAAAVTEFSDLNGSVGLAQLPSSVITQNGAQSLYDKTLYDTTLANQTDITGKLRITGSDFGAGKILQSTSNGTAEWVSHDTWSLDAFNGASSDAVFVDANGAVGIGATDASTQGATLLVNGKIMITDGSQANGYLMVSDANGLASWQSVSALNISSGLADDTSPTLSGDLNVNGNSIISEANGDITLDPGGNGDVIVNVDDPDAQFFVNGDAAINGGKLTVGTLTLNGNSITDSTGTIDFGDENLVTNGSITVGSMTLSSLGINSLDLQEGNIVNVGNIALDSISSDVNTIEINAGTSFTVNAGTSMDFSPDTSFNIDLGDDPGDDFTIESTTLVVEGDTGNVGIGTASPSEMLHVTGNARIDGNLIVNGTPISIGTDLFVNGGDAAVSDRTIGNTTDYSLSIITNGNPAITIDDNGNVGIGDTTPDEFMEINGDTLVNGTLTADNLEAGTNVTAGTSVIAGDMTMISGSITDSGGAISFGDENLFTTGNLQAANLTGTNSVHAGNVTISSGTISDSGGTIDFNGNDLQTTGTVDFGASRVDSLDLSEGNITNVGIIGLDRITSDGDTIDIDTTNGITLDPGTSLAIDLGGAAGNDLTVNGNLFTIEGDTGEVGIGVADPQAALHVNGEIIISGGSPGVNKILAGADNNGLAVWADATNLSEYTDNGDIAGADRTLGNLDNYALTMVTNGTSRMYLAANGDIGIGTDSPTEKLEVNGNVVISGSINAGSLSINGLDLSNGDITNVGDISLASLSADVGGITVSLGGTAGDDFAVDTDTLVVESDTNRVGIGTSSPTADLDVAGSINGLSLSIGGNAVIDGTLSVNGSVIPTMDQLFAEGGDTAGGDRTLGNNDDYDLNLEVNGTTAIHIDNGGSIGIGTLAPTSTFHVNGAVSASIRNVSTDTTLSSTDHAVVVDASGGAVTITLPPAADVSGRIYHIKKRDGTYNAVVIDGAGADTVDAGATIELEVPYQSYRVHSDGSAWWVF